MANEEHVALLKQGVEAWNVWRLESVPRNLDLRPNLYMADLREANESRPVKGRSDYELVLEDVRWQFASEVNRDLFRADPERYAPQYLGHCSLGIAEGDKSEVDPEAWAIVDGKLYLNGDLRVHERWEKNRAANINQADANWPALRNK